MSPLVYLSGALAIGCAALGLWARAQSATIDARNATIKERDATIVLKDQQIQQAALTNSQNQATMIQLRAERDAASAIAIQFDDFARERDARLSAILDQIAHTPADEDGPVPKVLERQLETMRELSMPPLRGTITPPD